MASVPEDENTVDDATGFNPEKMTKLFNVGRNFGINGVKWQPNIFIEEYDNRYLINR